MIDPRRLQRHLRTSMGAQTQALRVGPYTLFYHADAPYPELNVAIPDEPAEGRRIPVQGQEASGLAAVADDDPEYALMMLEAQFRARHRTPRVEFVAECHPDLVGLLTSSGYVEDVRVPLLVSTSATWASAPEVEGMRFEAVLPTSAWTTTRDYLEVQREAYGLSLPVPTVAPKDAWSALGIGAGVLASIDGKPVGAGGFTTPRDGLCEIRGLAVVPAMRRKGVGTLLLSALARVAHEGGVEAVVATPEGPATARMAKKAGYVACGTLVGFRAEVAAAR